MNQLRRYHFLPDAFLTTHAHFHDDPRRVMSRQPSSNTLTPLHAQCDGSEQALHARQARFRSIGVKDNDEVQQQHHAARQHVCGENAAIFDLPRQWNVHGGAAAQYDQLQVDSRSSTH